MSEPLGGNYSHDYDYYGDGYYSEEEEDAFRNLAICPSCGLVKWVDDYGYCEYCYDEFIRPNLIAPGEADDSTH